MTTLEFQSWSPFRAKKTLALERWLKAVGEASEKAFRSGMGRFPPASAPGAWPHSRTGGLRGSIKHTVSGTEVTISTSMPYSGYLRTGTSKMGRRKMSDDALKAGMRSAGRMGKWVGWMRGGTE